MEPNANPEARHRRVLTFGFVAAYLAAMGGLVAVTSPLAEGLRPVIFGTLSCLGIVGVVCIVIAKRMQF